MEEKGELTSKQLITIIILVVSFVIILLFYFSLNLNSEVNKESCRNSVVLRGTPLGGATKLNCKTQDICLSAGGNCNSAGSDTINLDAKTERQPFDEVSNTMYDCWWQMGGGKVNYAPKGLLEHSYCSICNTIHADDKLKANSDLNKINMKDYYTYLQEKKISNSDESYLHYLYGFDSIEKVRSSILESTQGKVDLYEQNIDLTNPSGYALVTATTKAGNWEKILGGTLIGTGAALVGLATGGIGYLFIGGAIVGGATTFIASNGDEDHTSPVLYSFDGEAIKALNCYEFSSLS